MTEKEVTITAGQFESLGSDSGSNRINAHEVTARSVTVTIPRHSDREIVGRLNSRLRGQTVRDADTSR